MTTATYVEGILAHEHAPDVVVLCDEERSLTIGQLRAEVYAVAHVLADLGLRAGSRLGLLTDNECAALTVRYAAHLLGCTTVHLPDAGDPFRLATFLRETEAETVLVSRGRVDHLSAALCADGGRPPLILSAGPVEAEHLQAAADVLALARDAGTRPSGLELGSHTPESAGSLVTSGGTTGNPKASLRSLAEWTALVTGRNDFDRRQLVCTPIAYVAQVLADQTLVGGGSVVLRSADVPFDPAAILAAIETEQITHLCLVEPAVVELLDHPDLLRRDLGSLVAISHIGADASSALRRRLLARLQTAGLVDVLAHTYGSSEVGLVSALFGGEYSEQYPAGLSSAGRPLPGVQVTLEGPVAEGRPGEGEIVVRSAGVCRTTSRYPRPEDDPAYDGPHTRRTGDWGYIDGAGRLTVRGRLGDGVPESRGLLFPVDVQDALCAHPDVAYAVAVPSRSAGLCSTGFAVAVMLLPGREVDAAALLDAAEGVPVDRIIVVEHIPVTEQGKPDRLALAELFAEQYDASVA